MNDVIERFAEQNRILAAHVAVISENYAAMNAMADDIVDAVERRNRSGHREFSMFTGESGRP